MAIEQVVISGEILARDEDTRALSVVVQGSPAQAGEAAAAIELLRTTTTPGPQVVNVTDTSQTLAALGVTLDPEVKKLLVQNQGTGPIAYRIGTATLATGLVIPAWGSKVLEFNAATLATFQFISGGSEAVAFEQSQ